MHADASGICGNGRTELAHRVLIERRCGRRSSRTLRAAPWCCGFVPHRNFGERPYSPRFSHARPAHRLGGAPCSWQRATSDAAASPQGGGNRACRHVAGWLGTLVVDLVLTLKLAQLDRSSRDQNYVDHPLLWQDCGTPGETVSAARKPVVPRRAGSLPPARLVVALSAMQQECLRLRIQHRQAAGAGGFSTAEPEHVQTS